MATKTLTSGNDTYDAARYGETTTVNGGAGTDTVYLDGRAGVKLAFTYDGTNIHVDGASGASAWHFTLINVEKFKYGNTVTDLTAMFPAAFGSGTPTIAITSNLSQLKSGQTATITFTLSEASSDFTAADVTVSGGALSNFSGSGSLYTATFTPATNSTASALISVASNKFSNAGGSFNADGSEANNAVSIAVDTIAPAVVAYSPVDGAAAAETDANIVLTFSEAIQFGTSGTVVIKSGGNVVESYSVTTPGSNLTISGTTLTINPTATLTTNTQYTVEISSTAMTDMAGNAYTQALVYDFTTSATNIMVGTAKNDTLIGTSGKDKITGLAGNDILDGKADADIMIGGLGNDTYVVDNADDVVTEDLNAGTDLVKSGISYALGANVENLTLTDGTATGGTAAINGTGNALVNTITGNAGDNVIDGGAGKDKLIGGEGDDTYYVDLLAGKLEDAITETKNATNQDTLVLRSATDYTAAKNLVFTLAANLENLDASGTGAGMLDFKGNTANNILIGNAGNNLIDGLAGADTMSGGAGDDTYVLDNINDVVIEQSNAGTDLIKVVSKVANETYVLSANIENGLLASTVAGNLTGNGLDNLLTGNKAANTLTGGNGDDTLNGAAGTDTMMGGNGDDTYYVDNIGDIVDETSGNGTDLVFSTVSYSLDTLAAAEVENLTLTGTKAANASGNDLANIVIGNAGVNMIDGGAGADTLTGGAGKDVFLFKNSDAVDTITDFVSATDKIAFSQLTFSEVVASKAVTAKGVAIAATDFLSGTEVTAASSTGQHVLYDADSGALYYDADGAGGNDAIQIALLGTATHPALTAADILVVL